MTPADQALGAVHARTLAYRRRLEDTKRLLARGLALAPDAYVSFSGGKDSAVCLDLARAIAPTIPARILLWTESQLLDDYAGCLAAWAARGVEVETVTLHRDRLDDAVAGRWQALGAASVIMGLRAEESRGRALTLRTHGPVYQRRDGRWRICPLAWWTTRDVIAYHVVRELPVLDAYRHDGMATRTATRVPRASVRAEALAALKRRDLAAWNQLVALYPEAAEWT